MDGPSLRDPAGLLARSPELARLAERSPALRRAVENGRPLDAYRALFWGHHLRRFGDASDLAKDLLGRRRLFVKPLGGSAPGMFTFNGFGTRLMGRTDFDGDDATFVSTLYVVALFIVPLFPIGSYLVRDSADRPGRSWLFMAKVPLSAATHLWQRAVALGLMAVLVSGGASAFHGLRHGKVHVVSALARPLDVAISGAAPVRVGTWPVVVDASAGKHTIVVKDGDRVVESATIDVPGGNGDVVWDVLGAGLVYTEEVIYAPEGTSPATRDPVAHCGETVVPVHGVDYLFVDAPPSISVGEHSGPVRKTVMRARLGDADACVHYLAGTRDLQGAARLEIRIAEGLRLGPADLDGAFSHLLVALPEAEADAFVAALLQREDGVEAHRLHQDVLIERGQRARAVEEYDARLASHAGSPDAEYLALRVRPLDDEVARIDGLVARYPDHAYLRRIHFYVHHAALDFAPALDSADVLRRVDKKAWLELLEGVVESMVALGHGDAALTMLEDMDGDRALPQPERRAAKLLATRVARRIDAPIPASDALDEDQKELDLFTRATAGMKLTEADLASIETPGVREALTIARLARTDPDQALARIERAPAAAIPPLPAAVRLLLFAEAVRRDQGAIANKLTADLAPDATLAAMMALVHRGESSEPVMSISLEGRAALEFVRSRVAGIPAAEKKAWIARAQAADVFQGPVTIAMLGWKP